MAKVEFGKIIAIETIKELLEKELGPEFEIKIKKNRIVIVQDSTKGCSIRLKEKNGATICKGPYGSMPSFGLRMLYSLANIALIYYLIWNMGYIGIAISLLPSTLMVLIIRTPSLQLVNNVKDIIELQAAQGVKPGAYEQKALDEKLVNQITNNYELKNTPELEAILNDHDISQYSYEAFESIRRILSTREKNILRDVKENFQSGKSAEDALRIKKQEEMSAYIQESLEDRLNRKEEVESSINTFRSKCKVILITGACFLLLILAVAVYLWDLEFFLFYMAVLFLVAGLPFMHYSKRSKAHTRMLENIDNDIATLSIARKQESDLEVH